MCMLGIRVGVGVRVGVRVMVRVGVGVRVRVRVRGGAVAHRVVTAISKFQLVDLLRGEHLVLGLGV